MTTFYDLVRLDTFADNGYIVPAVNSQSKQQAKGPKMHRIPTVFARSEKNPWLVTDKITEGCEWINDPGVVATQKHDGIAVLIRDGKMYKRLVLKAGVEAQASFEVTGEPDDEGRQPGWVPVGPKDQMHREAGFEMAFNGNGIAPILKDSLKDGTYELCGPGILGNQEKLDRATLIPHGSVLIENSPTDNRELRKWMWDKDIEGVVWKHPDGRMAKVRKCELGMKRVYKPKGPAAQEKKPESLEKMAIKEQRRLAYEAKQKKPDKAPAKADAKPNLKPEQNAKQSAWLERLRKKQSAQGDK